MKTRAVIAVTLISISLAGCVTTNEPQAHVEECHVKDGMLLDSSACVTDHNKIVADREAQMAKQRALRPSNIGTRR